MKIIITPERRLYDEATNIVTSVPATKLRLEHSLVSISKWEAKYKKPFISDKPEHKKSREETIDYIRFMTIDSNVDPNVYLCLSEQNLNDISDYIEDPMTASFVYDDDKKKGPKEQITSELIYWWMTALQIPWEAQKWHLNRLMMLIRIGSVKSQPEEKKTKAEILARNKQLNDMRRKKFKTKG